MAKDRNTFVSELVAGYRPRPALPLPSLRAAAWFAGSLALTVALTLLVQAFRPGFSQQLLHHPVLLAEVAGALFLGWVVAYVVLTQAVPGARVSRRALVALGSLAAVFGIGLALGFTHLAPASSTLGARHACWLEALVYGALAMGLLVLMARKAFLRFTFAGGVLFGLAAGLLPAAVMQLACMYDPVHGVLFHYAPGVAVVGVGLLLSRVLRRG